MAGPIRYNARPMGRPWEYPRWRRVLMQAVMWVILAGTLGLAQLVVVERRQAPVALDPPMRVGPIRVQVPAGWSATEDSDPERGVVEVADKDQTRQLTVAVNRGRPGQELQRLLEQPGTGTQPINFAGLGQQGVLMERQFALRAPDGAVSHEDVMVAFTQLPSGYVIEVQLEQHGARVGVGDPAIVEAVANSITWAGPAAAPRKRVPPPPDARPDVF